METTTQEDSFKPGFARNSDGDPWECKHSWPPDCFVQCGGEGLVIVREGGSYQTAFFEAFPKDPKTFLRGEGKTIAEAEASAWNQFQRFAACPHPEFEKRGYTNGAGTCTRCGMFKSNAFEPTEHCFVCGAATYYTQDNKDRWYCEAHWDSIAPEDQTDMHKHINKMRAVMATMKERSNDQNHTGR